MFRRTTERFKKEVEERKILALAIPPDQCCYCETNAPLTKFIFVWEKSRSRWIWNIEARHRTDHAVCDVCRPSFNRSRFTWGAVRWLAGIFLALGLIGAVTLPAILGMMNLNAREQRTVWIYCGPGIICLPLAVCGFELSRRKSVPKRLHVLLEKGWRCVFVFQASDEVDHARGFDVVMPKDNLISRTSDE